MPRLYAALLRHGEYQQRPDTPSAHQPFPLTEKGREQARRAALDLNRRARRLDCRIAEVIHSSELLRAWETATLVARHLDGAHSVQSFAALAERSVGCVANLTMAQIEAVVADDPRCGALPENWKADSRFRLPLAGAESLMEAGRRVAQHLCETMQQLEHRVREDTLAVFVGHGAAFRHAALTLGVLTVEDVTRLSMFHAEPVCVEWQKQGWRQVAGRWKIRKAADGLD